MAAAPLSDEESLGESRPEDAKKALEAAVAEGIDPEPGVILSIPEGFSSNTFGGHEGTTVIVEGSGGEVHIFIPDPAISSTGEESIVGESGLFSSNGWSLEKTGRQSQPGLPWATATFPFSGPGELEGVVWLGNFAGKEVQVTASAPSAQLDGFYGSIGAMLQTMQLRN